MHEFTDEELMAIIHSRGGPIPEERPPRLIHSKPRFPDLAPT